jgi:hypothetical protein
MNVIVKLLGTAVTLGAGFAAGKLVDTVWEKSTGSKPPKADDDMDASLPAVLTFAVVSAVVASVIQVLANRTTHRALLRLGTNPLGD